MRTLAGVLLALTLFSGTARAARCGSVPAWLPLREVSFLVVKPTESYTVKIQIPEIADLECSASYLEYGTDYSFALKDSDRIQLEYWVGDEKKASRLSDAFFLEAHSVLLAVEREKTPHYLEISDDELGVDYRVYLTAGKVPAYAKIRGSDQKLKVQGFRY